VRHAAYEVGVGVHVADKELAVADVGQVRIPQKRHGAQVGGGDEVVVLVCRVDDVIMATHLLHCDSTIFHCVASCFDEHVYYLFCNFDCINYFSSAKSTYYCNS
jgi:hypothetical protein